MLDKIVANTTLSPQQVSKLRGQAEEMEGVFINTLLKEMFASIETDAKSFGGGFAEETWRSMQSEQLSDAMAKNGGIGIADQMLGDLIKMQEQSQTSTNQRTMGVYR